MEGGEEEEVVEDPNGVSIEPCAQCLLPLGTTTGHFLLSGLGNGREVIAPLTNEEVGGIEGHPDQCPLARVCHGEALPWLSLQGHVGIRVPPGCILVVRKGLYGGPARVAPEVEGVAQVVEWRQVGEYAAVTDFVWLRRRNLVLDDAKKESKDLQQRLGVVEGQVCSLTSTLSASFTPSRGWGRQGCRVRVAGVRVGVNDFAKGVA